MAGSWYEAPEVIFAMITAIVVLGIGLIIGIIYLCCKRKYLKYNKNTTDVESCAVELRSNVNFQCAKEIEKQQVPLDFYVPRRSYPGSPVENSPKPRKFSLDPRSLDPKLYRSEEAKTVSPYSGLGRISFTIVYDVENERLTIHLTSGYQLPAKAGNIFPQPYVKLCLLPDKKRKMQSRAQKGSHPDFNEDFIFSISEDELFNRILRFTICDFDRFSRQSVIGYVLVPLCDRKEAILSEQGTGVIWKEILEDPTPPGREKGDVLFSLSYLPTAGRLSFVCLKGKNLNVIDDKDSGVAVKISLISGGKPIKTKKTAIRKLDLQNPIFNESFVFDTNTDTLDRVSLVIAAYAYMGLGSGKRLIGRVTVGPYMYSVGDGLAHWNDMLASPRSAVAQWHKLS